MAALKFFKVIALPGTLEADAWYLVENGNFAETYVTDAAGSAKSIGNTAMIEAIASALIAAELADLNTVEIVANIAARDALAGEDRNMMVMVLDATGDATVAAGAALYVFRNATNTFTKIAEYEGMDVTVTWAGISGKPSSAPALIDDAVTKRHAHANQATLDKFGESGGSPTFDGSPIGAPAWDDLDW